MYCIYIYIVGVKPTWATMLELRPYVQDKARKVTCVIPEINCLHMFERLFTFLCDFTSCF